MKSNRTTALLMLLVFLLVVAVVIIFLTGLDRPTNTGNPYENVTSTALPTIETPEPSVEPEPSAAPTVAPTSNVPVYYPPSTSMPTETARPVTTASPSGTSNTGAGGGGASVPTPTPSAAIPGADPNMLPAEDLVPIVPGANTGSGTDGSGNSAPAVIPTGTSLGSGTFRSDSGTAINIHADWNALVSGQNTIDVTITAYVDSYSLMTTASPEALNIAIDGQYISLASPTIDIPTTVNQVTTLINNRTFTIPLTGGETRSIPVEVVWNYRGTYGGTYLDTIECGGNITLSR